jgi:amino acid adenylation domain-containing protein
LAREEGGSLFMVLLAGLQAVLARYSGQHDFAIGTPIAGRNHRELEGVVGFFVNTLVLRADLSGRPTFREILRRVRQVCLDAYAHQDVPFERLVEELQPRRDAGRSPFFQVMLALQNMALPEARLPGLEITPLAAELGLAKFDLTLALAEVGDRLLGQLEYRTDLWDKDTIEHLAEHLQALLQGVAVNPDVALGHLPVLPPSEEHQVVADFNATARDYGPPACLHQLIAKQLGRNGQAVAVSYEGEVLNAGQLEARANQVGRYLQSLGVGPGALVGVCAERSLELVVALLGVLKSGAAYVPLDPGYPAERLAFMLADANVEVLLTQQRLVNMLPPHNAQTVCLDSDWAKVAQQPAHAPASGVSPAHAAYMIYTSGSTGRPKGALNSHHAIVNRLLWMQQQYQLRPDDVVLQKTPFSFDVSVWEFFWPLLTGARLAVARPGGHQDPAYLADTIAREKVTTLHFVPPMLQMLLETAGLETVCRSVRRVVCSGEALPLALQQRCYARLPWVELHNLYGPTEAAVDVTFWHCERVPSRPLVPIGRPVANTQIYVLDASLRPAPVGVPGELYIGGTQVGMGYWHRPVLTAEKFVPDPFGAAGARLYRTGDVARWLADGALEYLGRLDHQVKVRGFRIELGEIEAALASHPGVRECVVLGREDVSGDKRLVAYVVSSSEVSATALRDHVRGRLPDHMVPSAVVFLAALPLSANGKVDRRALPAPEGSGIAVRAAHVPPAGPVEEAVAAVWSEVLGVPQVGAQDNFFDLGGHSLLAAQVVARISERAAVDLPLRALFESPTVAGLAHAATEAMTQGRPSLLPPLAKHQRQPDPDGLVRVPASFAQARLWFLDRLQPGTAQYTIPVAVRLAGRLDVSALHASLQAIVARHDALRTTFELAADGPLQVIHPSRDASLPLDDLRGLPADQREQRLRGWLAREVLRPFDLSSGPLLRAALARLSDTEHVALVAMHHVISDAWSTAVLLRELLALYPNFVRGLPSPLPPLSLQYADYTLWQRGYLQGQHLDEQLAYWRQQLAGLTDLDLPTDRPRPPVASAVGAQVPFVLSPETTAGLRRLAREEGATLFMVLLAGLQAVLARYSGQNDVAVGTAVAGRNHRELEALVGFFVNTLVLRVDLSERPSFRELVRQVRQVCLAAYAHQDVPFERLVEELQPRRDPGRSPLFQVMLSWQNLALPEARLAGLEAKPEPAFAEVAKFDLTLQVAEQSDSVRGLLEYRTDLWEQESMERLCQHLQTLLDSAVAAPQETVGHLPLLSAAEEQQVLRVLNTSSMAVPQQSIQVLLEQRAAEAPEAEALAGRGWSLSRRELEGRSRRLAAALLRWGVRRGDVVAVAAERTAETVVALLGVLRAGAAFLPLDVSYPAERLAYLLADAQVRLVLASPQARPLLPECPAPQRWLEEVAEGDDKSLGVTVRPQDAAYVIYTSGSTGRPKGVVVEHRGLANLAVAVGLALGVRASDRVLQFAPWSFDASVWETFVTLAAGATLVQAAAEELRPGRELQETLQRQRISLVTLPPSVLAVLSAEGLPELREVVSASEALPADVAARWSAGRVLVNAYGPTENTVCATVGEHAVGERVSIGRPLANVQVYVLDRLLRPCGVGVPGELYLGGQGVARGYLGKAGLTAERFVPDRYGSVPGARLYRTGDVGRWLGNGTLDYLGRADEQLKVRGVRIEPGEVETALREHAGVVEAVVLARDDAGTGKRLVAYVVPAAGQEIDTGALRAFLQGRLPEALVPTAYVVLGWLPRTPSGKLDRQALPAPEVGAKAAYVAPRGPVEEVVAEVWSEVLGVAQVGAQDNFFDLGGHSLLAAQVITRISEQLAIDLPMRALFESATVRGLAQAASEAMVVGRPSLLPPLEPETRQPDASGLVRLPTSFAQARLWFLDRLQPGSAQYTIPAGVRLVGRLDVAALRNSLQEIVQRHEVLRTTFVLGPDGPVQVIYATAELSLPVDDLSELPQEEREQHARLRARQEAVRPFDLSTGPLLRAILLRLTEHEHIVLVMAHHIVADAWSAGVLLRELAALYPAIQRGAPCPLPPLPIQYGDYAVWQRRHLEGAVLQKQLIYWKQQLAGVSDLDLPTDRPRPRTIGTEVVEAPLSFSLETTAALRQLGRDEGATLFMTMLAGLQAELGRTSGQTDFAVGSPVAGRTRPEVEGLIGFFVNTLVLRADLSGAPSFRDLLRRVRQVCLDAYAHQEVPFERLVEELQPRRDPGRSPLFQALFTFQDQPLPQVRLPGLELVPLPVSLEAVKFDIVLVLGDTPAGLRGALRGRSDLFEAETLRRLAESLTRLFEAAAVAPDKDIDQLAPLAEAERSQVVVEWNALRQDVPDVPIHLLLAEHAKAHPDQIAVIGPGGPCTWGQLQHRSELLAGGLQSWGIARGDLVAVVGDRSAETVAAFLGVLQAGAAFLPIDPSHPADRLGYLLQDAQAKLLLAPEQLRARLPRTTVATRWFDDVKDVRGRPMPTIVQPKDAAYVIYTSGSTGQPKGVVVEHRGLVNLALTQRAAFDVHREDRVLQFASWSFDASISEVFVTLAAGGTMVLGTAEELRPGRELHDTLRRQEVSFVTLPPSVLAVLPSEGLPQLRTIVSAGEALPSDVAARWSVGRRLLNAYGPTENTVCATVGDYVVGERVSIGRPLANVQVYVLNRHFRPCEVGAAGELYLGGTGVARGYLHRAGLTAERFIPDPFGGEVGSRLYRTGDVGRWLPNGTIEYLGRADEQVKVRGVRIEPGEVEAALREHNAIAEAVVVARDDAGTGKRLVAYLVVAGGQAIDTGELRAFLQARLPEALLPSAHVVLEGLPRTPSGKIDRKALPAPEVQSRRAYVAPRTALERYLAELWQHQLGIERIGIDDNFFEVGGDSIRGAVLVNALQEQLGEYVYTVALFDAPTIAGLVNYLGTNNPEPVRRLFGSESLPADALLDDSPIDEQAVTDFRAALRALPPTTGEDTRTKCPPAVFLLSAPRSGSTLSRVMLGGHPLLFSPPELQLLNFETMRERRRVLDTDRDRFWLDGTVRAVMEALDCPVEEARAWLDQCEEEDLTVQQFYGRLQTSLRDRLLVDKTPWYALDLNTLERAEAYFNETKYIHLVRHPCAVMASFEEAKLQAFLPLFLSGPLRRSPRRLAELVWQVSNANILQFLNTIPAQRRISVRFEELVSSPQEVMERVASFLGLPFDAEMVQPHKESHSRMTDPVTPGGVMLGDIKFHQHKGIDPSAAVRWRERGIPELRAPTWDLAEQLGYPREWATQVQALTLPPLQRVERVTDQAGVVRLPASYSQARLWFLDRLQPGLSQYNVPAAVRLSGHLDVAALRGSLREIVRRHEVLRTTFELGAEGPVQVVHADSDIDLPLLDLSDFGPAQRNEELRRVVRDQARRPFDLSAGPLLRTCLVKLSEVEHVAVVTLHHVISDAWSVGVLLRELLGLYPALRVGLGSPLPPLPVQYGDYAAWQRHWLQGEVLERQVAHWRRRLSGLPELELPTDRARPAIQSGEGAVVSFEAPAEVLSGLRRLAQQEGSSLFMVVLAGVQAVLGKYSGQQDFAVGTPMAGRNRREVEGLVGFFVNTLVLRADLSGRPTFRDLVRRARQECVEAFAHQDVPFERLVEELRPRRDAGRSPFFQVLVALQNVAVPEVRLPGLEVGPLAVETGTAKFDLTVALAEAGERLAGQLEYRTYLWDRSSIERLAAHLVELLRQVAADADAPLNRVSLLGAEERSAVLGRWANPARAFPVATSLHHRFAEQAARTPDAVAVSYEDAAWTYAELDRESNVIATHLRAAGVGPETIVGLCAERSLELVAGALGTLKAGGAYLPLDPAYPAERLALLQEDAGAPVALVQPHLRDRLPKDGVSLVELTPSTEAERASAENAPEIVVHPDQPAYVIYTSGSTGRPKGVVVTHGNVLRLMAATQAWFGFDGSDVWTLFHSYAFDFSVWELWGALLYGGRLVVVPYEVSRSPDGFRHLLAEEGVTVLNQTPSAFRQLIAADEHATSPLSLRYVIFGGEALELASLQPWLARHGDCRPQLVNMYGITETTVHVTYHPVTAAEALAGKGSVIGVPIPDLSVYVLDSLGRPCPVGVWGEIHVGGAGVARGYLKRPALTAARFVPDPYSEIAGARLYCSGDQGRWLPDGTLEYRGRIDLQVKVRGFRIELGEVEAVLASHPAVRECVVLCREDVPGDRRLVGYVVPRGEVSVADLRAHARSRLPEYMVPAAVILLDRLPLTTNGKVDRRALPVPEASRLAARAEYVAPRGPVEELVAAVWSEVLGVPRVGAEDNFFDLGGHSLLAVQVVSRIGERLGIDLPVRTMFESPTVAAVGQAATEVLGSGKASRLPPVERQPRAEDGTGAVRLPSSFAQSRLWFLDRLQPGTAQYNIPAAVRLSGRLDIAALRGALQEIVRRHEALRTTFALTVEGPVQVIHPILDVPLPVEDVTTVPEEQREQRLREQAREEVRRPFDLFRGPLLRARLLRLGEAEHVAVVTMHHVISDGWSVGVLLRELLALYPALQRGLPSPLPALPVQYGDYAVWQRRHLQGEALQEQVGYWKEQLRGLPELDMPTDRARPVVAGLASAAAALELPQELTERLRALAREEGASLFMVLLAGLQAVLGRYSGQQDFAVGTPVAGRNRRELEGLVGFFVNTLVLRADLSGSPTFREMLWRARKACLDAYAHQDVPFEKLVEELQPRRDAGRSPFFQVLLVLQNMALPEARLPGLEVTSLAAELGAAKFDLTLSLAEIGDRLAGQLEYRTDLWDKETIQNLSEHLLVFLAAVAEAPDAPLKRAPLVPKQVQDQMLLSMRAATAVHFGRPTCLHVLIAEELGRHPEAVAVSYEGQTLTCRQLDERTNQLAGYLHSVGIGPGALVAVCAERSLELVVALLGVLKSGAAYVPLDPGYPAERLAFMIKDSNVQMLLTQERLVASLPPHRTQAVSLDADWDKISQKPTHIAMSAVTPAHPAYMIYTSGSTGRPKGALNSHHAIVNRLLWMQREYQLGQDDVVLQKTPFSFDVSVWEFFWPLLTGARLAVARPGGHQDPVYLADTIAREHVTTLHFVPPMLQVFLETVGLETTCRSVRRVVCSGEALPLALQQRCYARLPWVELHNLYGPTEAAVDVTFWHCERVPSRPLVPIGRPVANTQIYVLDPSLQPTPVGVPGELFIGGVQVGMGYWRRPALTAEKFVPDPLGPAGTRLYRTGDVARWLADGAIEYLGRIDHQVKVRGFRIELGEIEAALATHSSVRECVVLGREDAPGDKRLVAYVVTRGEGSAAELRAHVGSRLPDHMVPSAVVFLDKLPLSPNGKVDRRALPIPDTMGLAVRAAYVAPSGPVEEAIAAMWSEVLGSPRIGGQDNFFDLGGHSLLAAQVVSRISEQLGVDLSVRSLFERPTVTGLAQAATEAMTLGRPSQLPPVEREPRETDSTGTVRLPASFAQARLWFLDRLQPGTAQYNIPAALRLSGRLDLDALQRTLQEIVRRHDGLRTTFGIGDEGPIQVIHPPSDVPLPVDDLSHLPAEEREEDLRQRVGREARRPFDLVRGPLLRASLLRLSDTEHVALVTMHHVISDGWSVNVLLRELLAIYPALLRGGSSPLPPLPVQYGDYSLWQRRYLQGEVLQRQLAYWKQQLAGITDLDLPTDRPRPPIATSNGAVVPFALSAETTARLRLAARQEGASLFMVLLAGLQAVLGRYSGQEDIVVGTPVAGRNRPELEGLVGFFVNTLALRGDLSGNPSFRDLIRRVRIVCLDAFAHQEVPFERLVEELQPRRDPGRSPLFQVMLTLQNLAVPEAHLPGLEIMPLAAEVGTAKFDLTLQLIETDGGVRGQIEHRADLWQRESMERLGQHLRIFLEGVAANPDALIWRLPLLAEEELARVLYGWNGGATELADLSVHDFLAEHAVYRRGATALVGEDPVMTWDELERESRRLAQGLRRWGIGRGDIVAVVGERTPHTVAAMLGVTRAGAAFLPIDPSYPADRLAYLLADAGARLILAPAHLRAVLPPDRAAARWFEDLIDADNAPLRLRVRLEDAAYVIYTSGSTGKPKGVVVEHRGLVNLVRTAGPALSLQPGDRVLQFAPWSFDASVWETFVTLAAGATLVLAPPDRLRPGRELHDTLREQRITLVTLPPSVLAVLPADNLPDLERVVSASEALPPDVAQRWAVGRRLINAYGPTENTVCATTGVYRAGERIHIGRPLGNVQVYVLDRLRRPCPVGAPGEMYLGGDGVARGYLNRQGLTAERFVPDLYGGTLGGRLYRTGDVGRWLADGSLEYLGRADQQVKVRGVRIEPGEVEAALRDHPAVAEAVVAARDDAGAGKRLVAYVVPADGQSPDVVKLRAFLQDRLPEALVPSAFVMLEALPRTPSGKLDRKSLPAPELQSRGAYVAPATALERYLVSLWQHQLGVERVGIDDNFFELGGDSIRGAVLVNKVQEMLGEQVYTVAMFEAPTTSSLARYLGANHPAAVKRLFGAESLPPDVFFEEARPATPTRALEEVPRLPRVAGPDGLVRLPQSFAQQRLWFLDQLRPGSPFYNLPAAVRLRGQLNAALLQQALNEIVRRHESLRTTCGAEGDAPVQIIAPPGPLPLLIHDLTALPERDREAELERLVLLEAQRPFELARGPLVRVTLVRLVVDEHAVLVTMHHIISDGWSAGIFIRELAVLYTAYEMGRPSPLPEPMLQFADFAAWQRGQLQGALLEEQLTYWREQLTGMPDLDLPTDRPRPPVPSFRGGAVQFDISLEVVGRLQAVARQEGATLFMALLTVYQAVLGRYARQEDFGVGSPLAGRGRAELQGMIGFFVNMLVLRANLRGRPSYREALRRARDASLGAFQHQDVPFEKLALEMRPERDPSRSPLFQVGFVLQNNPPPRYDTPGGLQISRLAPDLEVCKWDMNLTAVDGIQGVSLRWTFSTDLFEAATVQRMARHFQALLEAVVDNPDRRLADIPLGAAEEEAEVIEWGGSSGKEPTDDTGFEEVRL